MSQQIIIDISPTGAVKVEAEGFTGNSCSLATEQLMVVLGGNGEKKTDYKPEFSMPASTAQHNRDTF